jgi:hypothetical protein
MSDAFTFGLTLTCTTEAKTHSDWSASVSLALSVKREKPVPMNGAWT